MFLVTAFIAFLIYRNGNAEFKEIIWEVFNSALDLAGKLFKLPFRLIELVIHPKNIREKIILRPPQSLPTEAVIKSTQSLTTEAVIKPTKSLVPEDIKVAHSTGRDQPYPIPSNFLKQSSYELSQLIIAVEWKISNPFDSHKDFKYYLSKINIKEWYIHRNITGSPQEINDTLRKQYLAIVSSSSKAIQAGQNRAFIREMEINTLVDNSKKAA